VLLELLHHGATFHATIRHTANSHYFLIRVGTLYASLGVDANVSSFTSDKQPEKFCIAVKCHDQNLYRWCSKLLEAAGYIVRMIEDPNAISLESGRGHPGLTLLLQSTLNNRDLDWCIRHTSENTALPLLVISTRKDTETELSVLNAGADRYLSLPINPEHLKAHIEILRQRFAIPHAAPCALLHADSVSRRVWIAGSELQLPPVLFRLLNQFLTHPSEVLSFDMLHACIKTDRKKTQRTVVKAYVHLLRKILAPYGFANLIKTLHRVGYRFDPPIQ